MLLLDDFFAKFYSKYKTRDWFWLAIIFVACGAIMVEIPLAGIPDGYDVPQHLRFAATYYDAMLNGELIPGWASVDNHGFGSAGVRVYPPLADYLLAITQVFTNDWYTTLWTNSVFWLFPGCIGMYFWAKEYVSMQYATIAALMYAVVPYHLVQLFQFMLFSEFAAASILPFCFLYSTRIIKRGHWIDVLSLAVSYSLLLLAHIPSGIIGSLGLGIYCLFIIDWNNLLPTIQRFAIALALSLSATMFYWLRLVTEADWIKHSTPEFYSGTGFYSYQRHFFPLFNNYGEWYWIRLFWLLDITFVLSAIFLSPLLILVLLRTNRTAFTKSFQKFLFAISAAGLFSMFMSTELSTFIWNSAGVLQKIQFPWRFLSVASLIGAIAFTLAILILISRYEKAKKFIVYSAFAFVFAVILFDLTQTVLMAAPLSRDKFEEMTSNIRDEEGCSCWWPTWAQKAALVQKAKVIAGDREVEISTWDREERTFSIGVGQAGHAAIGEGTAGNARIATFWYPHWKADVNGSPVEVGRDENGAILIALPAERAEVRLYFQEPNFLRTAEIASLFTWLGILGFLGIYIIRRVKVS